MTDVVDVMSVRKVPVGDFALAVHESGSGPAVVWLHGSGPGASGMSNFRANLPAFADFRNLVFDHPRYGDSDRPHIDGPLIPHSGTHILLALDALGVERFSVVGNSFGGGVAAWLAATAQDRVSAAVLMAPGGVQPSGLTMADLPEGLKLIGKAMREGVDRPLMEAFVSTMLTNQALATDELIDMRLEAAQRNNPEWEGPPNMGDLTPLLRDITAPTQLLWGKDDRFVPYPWSLLWLEQMTEVELHVLPHSGHWLQYELRSTFDELAGEFLRRNTAMSDQPEIAQLGSATISTPNMEKSLWFFRDLLGMEEVEQDGDLVYLRAYQEHEHHSLILKDSNVAELENFSLRTKKPEDVEAFARALRERDIEVVEAPSGTKKGQGDSIRFFMPHGGHPIEIFYDIDKPKAPEAIRSLLPSNSSTRRGLGVRRIDHMNIHTSVDQVRPAVDFMKNTLGFKSREQFGIPDGPLFAAWTSVTPQVHDVAIVAAPNNQPAQLHHIAFNLENYADSMTAADVFRDQGVQIDLGPGKHGIGQALFLYVRDPGSGHRIELYAGGYLIFAPDHETIEWNADDFGNGLTWYGEPFPMGDHEMSHTTPSAAKLI